MTDQNIIITTNVTGEPCSRMNFSRCGSCPVKDLCWHGAKCQRLEITYQKWNKKCHPLCLGDCVDETSKGCYTCRDISEDSECVEQCSETK